MGVSNIQFNELLKTYDETRKRNEYEMNARINEICEKFPEYEELDRQTPEVASAALNKLLAGDMEGSLKERERIKQIAKRKKEILEENNYPADYVELKYTCEKCKDTGYIKSVKCSCLKNKIVEILYEQSKLKERLMVENFHTLSEDYYTGENLQLFRSAVNICKMMVKEYPDRATNVLFKGVVGAGKSFLSCCVAKEFLDAGHSVLYMSATEMFDALGRQRFERDRAEWENDNTIFECDLLVVDDLGTELANSFTRSALFELINRRIRDNKCTIISTNLNLNEICDDYSERIVSRIISSYKLCNIMSDKDIRIEKRRKIAEK